MSTCFEAQHSRAFGCSLHFRFIKERPSGIVVSTFIVSPCSWKITLVSCWWILKGLSLTLCNLFSLCCFRSKIYLPSLFISGVSNSLERVGEGPSMSWYFALIYVKVGHLHIKWYSSSISMWHNLHSLSSLGTLLARPFSISSWWDDILSCPMATLSAFDKNVSRYFGRVIKPNLEKCKKCSL